MINDQFLATFLAETRENLATVENALLVLEGNPDGLEGIDVIYRAMHTIKGGAGFFALENLQKIVHAAEALLGAMRDRRVPPSGAPIETLLQAVDVLRDALLHIECEGHEPNDCGGDLSERLAAFLEQKPEETIAAFGVFDEEETPSAPVPQPKNLDTSAPAPTGKENTIRVSTTSLEQLMNLVGELVLRRNEILNLTSRQASPALSSVCQRLNRITTELQESVMRLRMQPIGTLWNQYPRILRDLAQNCGKSVKITMDGQDTELDRSILEAVRDPLIHLVRNAVDHGIEPPEERVGRGKAREGHFALAARQEHGQVILEIADDGRGLDLARVRKKAVERGLLDPDRCSALSEKEVAHLIFLPGLSTAEKVTNISGRGIGMDVVKSSIQRVGGTIDVETNKGEGTRFKIKIPLTLAIVPALMVRSGPNSFAIPNVNLLEVLRYRKNAGSMRYERLNGQDVLRLRGELVPVLWLSSILGHDGKSDAEDAFYVLILQAQGRTFGLAVEMVEDIQEIVVKPLSESLRSIAIYSGVTTKSDGTIALILDVQALSGLPSVHPPRSVEKPVADEGGKTRRVLLVKSRDGLNVAIPIDHVARLERVAACDLEQTVEGVVTQRRRSIIPIFALEQFLDDAPFSHPTCFKGRELIPLVVQRIHGVDVGMAVDAIVDIAEAATDVLRPSTRPHVAGSTIIRNRVTEVLHMEAVHETLKRRLEASHG